MYWLQSRGYGLLLNQYKTGRNYVSQRSVKTKQANLINKLGVKWLDTEILQQGGQKRFKRLIHKHQANKNRFFPVKKLDKP